MKGCLRGVLLLLLLSVAAAVLWVYRDRVARRMSAVVGGTPAAADTSASPALAETAARKLSALANATDDRAALSGAEVQSLLLFRYRQLLPAFIDSPLVRVAGSRIELRARIPTNRLPQVKGLGEVASMLPDTAEIAMTGELLPLGTGRVALAVDHVSAARIPLPDRLIPAVLEKLGRRDEAGLSTDALAIHLPDGISAAYIRGDSLVFLGRNAGRGPQ